MPLTLEALNSLPTDEARAAFRLCCTATRWIDLMVNDRPFKDRAACHAVARAHWATLSEADYLEAFAGHPKIGNIDSLREKYADSKVLASGEQQGMTTADEHTLERLAALNLQYEAQNGFIFIVCATGKNAQEMLKILEDRLQKPRDQELMAAAAEQAKITAIRINKLLGYTGSPF